MRAHLLPKLRCYFAEFLHKGSLKRLWILTSPTCVRLRYGHPDLSLEVFLGSVGSTTSPKRGLEITPQGYDPADLPTRSPYVLRPAPPVAGWLTLLRHPIVQTRSEWYGNINPFPIDYAFRPRLRDRLTLGGLPLPRKPWASGERSSHPFYRYSCRQSHFCVPSAVLTVHLVSHTERSPTNPPCGGFRSFGRQLKPR